jgi:GST-like protein
MITLYTWKTPNGYKVPILLEELGVEYEIKPINISKGEQKTPEYLALNPNGKIPTFVDAEAVGGPLTIFESGAILEYLAEAHKRFIPTDVHGKYAVMEWLMFQMAAIGPMMGQLSHFVRFAPEKVPYAITRYTAEVKRLLGILDKRLGDVAYVAGDYSIADIALFPWVRGMKTMEDLFPMSDYPNIARWITEIEARPAVQTALTRVDVECV